MFVDVAFRIAQPLRLTVPASAVLDAGLTRRVFLDHGNGYFEPRAVQTGDRYGDRVVILSGLKEGDRIVTSGNFLIDSESQLKSATSAMGPPDDQPHH
jgi:multidrug efflux pump subunit AcrA (membrane-fusion protein)